MSEGVVHFPPRLSLWVRALMFLFPRSGWREDWAKFQAGQKVWEVPGRPDANKVIPWPLVWIPHKIVPAGTYPENDPKERVGFSFLPATCTDTGRPAPVGAAVACHRCAVPLHQSAAHMVSGFSVPTCSWCYFWRL